MSRTAMIATVWTWIGASVLCLAQQPPKTSMLPAPETAPPPRPVESKLVPTPPAAPAIAQGLTDGSGLTPLAMSAPTGAVPDKHKIGQNCHCYNHCLWRFFTYCPVLGSCGKGCYCCCPPPYTFFFCTPIPPVRIRAPFYAAMWPSTAGPLPTRTPLTPDPVPQPVNNASPVPH